MFNSGIWDVAIGLSCVYFAVSLLCSSIREGLEAWFKTRATYLEHTIRELLCDTKGTGLAKSLFNHPLIFGLFRGDYVPGGVRQPSVWTRSQRLPSYIPARSFAAALIDLAARGRCHDSASGDPAMDVISVAGLRASVGNLQNPPVQRVLLNAIDMAGPGGLDAVRSELERWYDAAMERVSGWYRRSTQWLLLGIALCVASALNINTLTLADYLYRNAAARGALVSVAEQAKPDMSAEQALQNVLALPLPIGWSQHISAAATTGSGRAQLQVWRDLAQPILGLLITALAATLGAPFWFDLLSRLGTLRATRKPEPGQAEPAQAAELRAELQRGLRELSAQLAANDQAHTRTSYFASKAHSGPSEEESDACDGGPIEHVTVDAELPPASGGVAP